MVLVLDGKAHGDGKNAGGTTTTNAKAWCGHGADAQYSSSGNSATSDRHVDGALADRLIYIVVQPVVCMRDSILNERAYSALLSLVLLCCFEISEKEREGLQQVPGTVQFYVRGPVEVKDFASVISTARYATSVCTL